MASPFKALTHEMAQAGEAQMWQCYDGITAQVLLLRGAQSDLLSPATATAMTQRGPKATLLEIEGVGHAPTLIAEDQTRAIADWLFDGSK
jgi:pimeloyl-ACP methyl ester carboxylesterase